MNDPRKKTGLKLIVCDPSPTIRALFRTLHTPHFKALAKRLAHRGDLQLVVSTKMDETATRSPP